MNNTITMAAPLPPITRYDNHSKAINMLTGPTYTMNGTKYHLPPPSSLRPNQDRQTGDLISWPAHASARVVDNLGAMMTRDKGLLARTDGGCSKHQVTPKPHFLQQLETFLQKELIVLNVTSVEPSELRLQAHREVFEYLIEDFKTYRPLLSAIKNEYEMMLSLQREELRRLQPLQQMLVTMAGDFDLKIMALQEMEKKEITGLHENERGLQHEIDVLRGEQLSLQAQVARLSEELSSEYLRYRDECDARKLLISDMNDLMYQAEDQVIITPGVPTIDGEVAENADDPVVLRLALKRAREDGRAAAQRLYEMEANYGDVIPRRDYEMLQKSMQDTQDSMADLKDDLAKLKNEHDVLLDVHKQVVQQRDDYYVESEKLRRSATPRPDWDHCADVISGGMERWKQLADNKTSDELMQVLLDEISSGGAATAGVNGDAPDFFEPKGTDENIPEYLRSSEPVRNRRLLKRDCMLFIQDIWNAKTLKDTHNADVKPQKMSDFFLEYLQQTFSLPQLVTEWAYNLNDACFRFGHDKYVALFADVLADEVDEQVYHSEVQMVTQLLKLFTQVDMDGGSTYGSISKVEMFEAMSTEFSLRSHEQISELLRAAEEQLEATDSENIAYKGLFLEDDEKKTGLFLEAVKRQYDQERHSYIDDIMNELQGVTTGATVEDVKKAITTTDPQIEQADLDRYLIWAFEVADKEALGAVTTKKTRTVLKARLINGNIRRIGNK